MLYLWGLAAPDQTVPYGTALLGRHFPRHFVPGYDRGCPYGTRCQTFRNSFSSALSDPQECDAAWNGPLREWADIQLIL
jgi:hypothetical protein